MNSYTLTLNVIVTVLQPGWDKVIAVRVQPAFFCTCRHFPNTQCPHTCTAKTFFAHRVTTARQKMPQPQHKSNTVLLDIMQFSCVHVQTQSVGSISALFTCSLLLHLKVVGVELFGCPPYPRHILCSVQFL